jgi:hypothetical protein
VKTVAFITTRRVLAQSLANVIEARPELGLEPQLLLNMEQAPLDAEVLRIDVAVIDQIDSTAERMVAALRVCAQIRSSVPSCRLILLLPQENAAGRDMAVEAKRSGNIDDFVFQDTSVEYLLAKLVAS